MFSNNIDINNDELYISFFLSSQGELKDFNRTSLNIKKYIVGKEKEELLTLGRSFVDIKYIVNEELNKTTDINITNKKNANTNINNNDNINLSNKNKNNDSISTNNTMGNNTIVKNEKKNNEVNNDNIVNKNNFDVVKENEIINLLEEV